MGLPRASELLVPKLGPCRVQSPLQIAPERFVPESRRVLVGTTTEEIEPLLAGDVEVPSFEVAGPRSQIFFTPNELTAAVVTCGGLCPGVNNVIRSIVLTLHYWYGVERILGFRYGYEGMSSNAKTPPLELTPEVVENIHQDGGTLLGSSRGPQVLEDMIDVLVRRNVSVLFAVGGDGTLRGASALSDEIRKRDLPISLIGIPKTIDNDLQWIERSFGFATAVEEARRAIAAAHCEARGAWNGIGLVKLMGRHSGFIAAHATLANADVNFCLVPEVPFTLEGRGGFLEALERRLELKHHAVIVVAEGAGQELLADSGPRERDASGNIRLQDVGIHLREAIGAYLTARGQEFTIKYIDPSYIIRSLPANSLDSELCLRLGQHAVHAGMSGRTDMLVGGWNREFTHVPILVSVSRRRQLNPHGSTWHGVLEATGQPASLVGRAG